jgi:hypothetical protein
MGRNLHRLRGGLAAGGERFDLIEQVTLLGGDLDPALLRGAAEELDLSHRFSSSSS